jgi:hypothetical protein
MILALIDILPTYLTPTRDFVVDTSRMDSSPITSGKHVNIQESRDCAGGEGGGQQRGPWKCIDGPYTYLVQ